MIGTGNMLPAGDSPLYLTLSLEEESILVGADVLEVLGRPRQIQMMLNDSQKKMLIQACTVDDREAVVVPPQPVLHFAVSGHSVLKRIRKITGWKDSLPRKVEGLRIPGHNVIVFDLLTAETVDLDGQSIVEAGCSDI